MTATASQVTVLHAPLSTRYSPDSLSQSTVIPRVPSPPSTPEIYGPDRYYGPQTAVARHVTGSVRFNPKVNYVPQLESVATAYGPMDLTPMDFRTELVRDVGASITPGIDEREVFEYALDALTQTREDAHQSSGSGELDPMHRYMPAATRGILQQPNAAYLHPGAGLGLGIAGGYMPDEDVVSPEDDLTARRRRRLSQASTVSEPGEPLVDLGLQRHTGDGQPPEVQVRPPSPPKNQSPRFARYWQAQRDEHEDWRRAARFPPLEYKPFMLRTPSLLILAFLNVLMVVGLLFCAIWSSQRRGLTAYSGRNDDGYYFVFRILPQLLAALLLIYAQCVITAAWRILPFSLMTSDDIRTRRNVGFLPLYPKSFLWPRLVSTWPVWIPIIVTWLLNFTIPLQSSLFTVVLVDGVWVWSTVQGVVWPLVALYVLMLCATCILVMFWHGRKTGFMPGWDLRSIADIIALTGQSNSLQPYIGTENATSRTEMRHLLYGNIERLGYWSSPDTPDVDGWYGLGVPTSDEKIDIEKLGPPVHEKDPRGFIPSMLWEDPQYDYNAGRSNLRYPYLPWCFRNSQVALWVVGATILLVALLAVSFSPSTDLRNGFLPMLSSAPLSGPFSAANFLYSFLPSLLGMMLFLAFQSLDLTLRILTPWGELKRKDGAPAKSSLLVDYAACLPLEITWKAIRNRHWRVAFVSALSTLSFLIPVLAGGLFMALTPSGGEVRMYPNLPAWGFLIALLVLYLLGLVSLVPYRNQFRLPHAVTCISEIISFCANDELRNDEAFSYATTSAVAKRQSLKSAVGAFAESESRWFFGVRGYGYNNRDERLGIKRLSKFTADRPRALGRARRHMAHKSKDGAAASAFYEHPMPNVPGRARVPIGRPEYNGSSSMIV
jgi:hypothetical protein